MSEYPVIDLFSGLGGFSQAFENPQPKQAKLTGEGGVAADA